MDENERYDQVCKLEFAEIKKVLFKIYNKLFEGNGQPPISVQLDRLNNFKKLVCWFMGVCTVTCFSVLARIIYLKIVG